MRFTTSPAVRAVCRTHHADADLVVHHIYAFLDASPQWTLSRAAAAGHLQLVQRLSSRTSPYADDAADAMDMAAKHGHLHVVQWLHRHRVEGCSAMALVYSSYAGHASVVTWLLTFRREGRVSDAIAGAAARGHEELVAWLLSHTHLRDVAPPLAPPATADEAISKPPASTTTARWVAVGEQVTAL